MAECTHTHTMLLQTVIQENPFTESMPRNESPVSIGEPLSTIPEGASGRKLSNPFRPTEEGRNVWELEKQQFTAQMVLLREQLKSETTARIESQVKRAALYGLLSSWSGIPNPMNLETFLFSVSSDLISGLLNQQ